MAFRSIRAPLALCLLLVLLAGRIRARTLEVSGGVPTLQQAIDNARDGLDEVVVAPGEYLLSESIDFRGKAITVRSQAGPRATIIHMRPDAPWVNGVVEFHGADRASILDGFTVSGARSADSFGGAGIYCWDSSPIIKNCIISENGGVMGGGVSCWGESSPLLFHCTITGNMHFGIFCGSSSPELIECIVWDNPGTAIEGETAVVSRSCVDDEGVLRLGPGNITADPRFRGLGDAAEVFVDSRGTAPGDGSSAHPYTDLAMALVFDPALSADTPCRDPESGETMGAFLNPADPPGVKARTVHVMAGQYSLGAANLAHHVSLLGQGEGVTAVKGPVAGLRTGAVLRDLTLSGGGPLGVLELGRGDAPEVRDCTIRDGVSAGVFCLGASPSLTGCTLTANSYVGLDCEDQCTPTLIGCRIKNSRTAIVCNGGANPTLLHGEISGNQRAALMTAFSSPIIEDFTIADNCAESLGPVLDLRSGLAALTHCTISGNLGPVVRFDEQQQQSRLFLDRCILWGNAGPAIQTTFPDRIHATNSCIEDFPPVNGSGNTDQDPLFVGWGDQDLVLVNAAANPGGDGSVLSPFNDLEAALRFDLALSRSSPCIGMGADLGISSLDRGKSRRQVLLEPGDYPVNRLNLVHHLSLVGSDHGVTRILGPVDGLRTGESMVSLVLSGEGSVVIGNQATPEITDCTFTRQGVGVSCRGSSPTFRNCRMVGSQIGGMELVDASPTIIDCIFDENIGTGLSMEHSQVATILRCSISRNGTGVNMSKSSASFSNCLIAGNKTQGILCFFGNFPVLESSTIAGNGEEGFYLLSSHPVLKNSIVWGNGKGTVASHVESDFTADHSCLESSTVWPGTGNLNLDPLFMDPKNGNYRLRSLSPLIDAGATEGNPGDDLDGIHRPCGGGVDMGAFEVCGNYFRRGDLDGNGRRDVIDVLLLLRTLFAGQALRCQKPADSDDTGELDLNDVVFGLNFLFLHGPDFPNPSTSCGLDPTPDMLDCDLDSSRCR
jgi:parallel beta helix pectate lyase-like protein